MPLPHSRNTTYAPVSPLPPEHWTPDERKLFGVLTDEMRGALERVGREHNIDATMIDVLDVLMAQQVALVVEGLRETGTLSVNFTE